MRRALQKLAYRFLLVYFTLYCVPFPLYFLPTTQGLANLHERVTQAVTLWFGENVLRLPEGSIVHQPTGSGDTMSNYVFALVVLLTALAVTLGWTVVDRLRSGSMAERWLPSYIRYALAAILLQYGFSKLPPMQFPFPGPEQLVRTYGESSPMGLLWTFMGASSAYQMFAGVAEIVPGLLLLFRRTSTLGALIGAATMTNVVALNFCYDVPVKLFSLHLLAMALLIAAPDLTRLFDLLLRHRAVQAPVPEPMPASVRVQVVLTAVRALLVIAILWSIGTSAYQGWFQYGGGAPRSAQAGVYDVTSFSVDDRLVPPMWTDTTRWRRFIVFGQRPWVTIQHMGGENRRFQFERHEPSGTLVLWTPGADPDTLSFVDSPDELRVLSGWFQSRRIRVELEKVDPDFLLTTRGFHWIQELPYNR